MGVDLTWIARRHGSLVVFHGRSTRLGCTGTTIRIRSAIRRSVILGVSPPQSLVARNRDVVGASRFKVIEP